MSTGYLRVDGMVGSGCRRNVHAEAIGSAVVAGPGLSKHEVVRPERLPERTASDGVHGSGLQIRQDSAGHVSSFDPLVVVHVDPLQLQVIVALVCAVLRDAVLRADHLRESEVNASEQQTRLITEAAT